MKKESEKQICPTCGQSMKHIESHSHTTKETEPNDEGEITEPKLKISEIWHCLNCSKEWQIDIMDNIWRKKDLNE